MFMREIFYELIEEASRGKVLIDGDEWPIGFNTIIYRDKDEFILENPQNINCLTIRDEEEFLTKLEEYIMLELELKRKTPNFVFNSSRNTIKYLIAYLFVNATTEDFINPFGLINRDISI